MVDVTKSNFEQELESIQESIQNSSFIAIDLEFTGIALGSAFKNFYYDSLQCRYEKYRAIASNFAPMQFGLSTFTWNKDDQGAGNKLYIAKAWNFYTFPDDGDHTVSLQRTFTSNPSSLKFLAVDSNFDVSKWVKEGIPYLSHDDEKKLLSTLDRRESHLAVDVEDEDVKAYLNEVK